MNEDEALLNVSNYQLLLSGRQINGNKKTINHLLKYSNLIIGSIIYGYLMFEGAVFCTHPSLMYPVGSLSVSKF